jgi:hypothetical protein
VTFEGDYVNGLAAVSVKAVEVVDKIQRLNFGEIEMDWGRDDREPPEENIPPVDDDK